ncbi:WD40/YVTN/BNR-like repeat-containing protein [Thalassolituus sp.]|jgi:photosystem II stability/assembly factor-like uncharacterized protein|uniref:WD40/YVTN/BNR-like repeat-containing protein n=1 Tax=Thalassolituus sp. TaxID=2030822 RepID=UPI003518B35E
MALSSVVNAGWQDPLDTPAMETLRAHEELLLDVTNAGDRLVSAGAHGHIVFSDDGGLSWRQGEVPVSVTLTSVDFYGERNGWAVGHDGVILGSEDGGKTWTKQFDGYQANKAILEAARSNLAVMEERAELAAEGSDEEADEAMMALETAQFTLQDAEYDFETGSTKPFLDVEFWSEKEGIAIGAYGMAFTTEDGGKSWQDMASRLPNPDRLHLNSITRTGEQTMVITGEMGLLLRSEDAGQSWTPQPSPYDGSLFGLVDKDKLQLLFALRGHVYQSWDEGITWEELNTGVEQTLLGGFETEKGAVLVGNGGAVILLDRNFRNPRSVILEGRKASAAVTRAAQGHFVIVGEAGVKLLDPQGHLMQAEISMAQGDL